MRTAAAFQTLRAVRLWLLGPTPAHIDRLGVCRVLNDLWVEQDALHKEMRRLKAQAAAAAAAANARAADHLCLPIVQR
jgi:hypothetical protein